MSTSTFLAMSSGAMDAIIIGVALPILFFIFLVVHSIGTRGAGGRRSDDPVRDGFLRGRDETGDGVKNVESKTTSFYCC